VPRRFRGTALASDLIAEITQAEEYRAP
jgi:hypothetical protein